VVAVIATRPARWDRVFDVIVLGSGAAGLAAAILASDGGAKVLLLEKADLIGGTTGVSGGVPWVPMNTHMADLGITDSREEALAYIRRLTLGREPDPALIEVYVDSAPKVIDYLEARTLLRMSAPSTFNDYYADLTGGKMAGRSIEPVPFRAGAELGEWADRLRTSPHLPWLTMEESALFLRGVEPPDYGLASRRQLEDERVLGPALVAALFKGLLDRGVEAVTGIAGRELVVADGQVIGLRTEHRAPGPGGRGSQLIGARRGVVLACGGFEWNPDMVQAFIGVPIEPLSPPSNEGDGHQMAMEAGAALANMTSFWGQPALLEPGVEYEGRPMMQMGTVRGAPGVIVVNRHGRRFTNEGVAYQDFPKAMATYDPVGVEYPNEEPNWVVFDQRVKDSVVILPSVLPGQPAPDWITRAPTVRGLAESIGVSPHALEATVDRWNEQVAAGEDLDYHRGTVWFEAQMSGDKPTPARSLRPIQVPPFYALRLYNGTLGTNGGVRIDGNARVLTHRGAAIPGLYAAGNVAASVFGPAYPGGGSTIGPALAFGYLAGRHAAAQPGREIGIG